MGPVLQILFFLLVVRPLTWVILGLNIRGRERLPSCGPAIVVANHNSHLDTLVLMSLFPFRELRRIRPVAAADYFLRWRWLAWSTRTLLGILPIDRRPTARGDHLAACKSALDEGAVLILFPEGTRGEPERMQAFKTGVAHLAKHADRTPVTPVFLHGAGKALPRGEALLVPFFVDVFVGEVLRWEQDRGDFMDRLEFSMDGLATQGQFATWH